MSISPILAQVQDPSPSKKACFLLDFAGFTLTLANEWY